MREQELQKQILDYLAYRKGKYWRQNSGAIVAEYKGKKRFFKFTGMKGLSDIIGILPDGRFFACEVKIKPNKPTDDQINFINCVNYHGGVGIIAYELNDVIEVFKKYEQHTNQI